MVTAGSFAVFIAKGGGEWKLFFQGEVGLEVGLEVVLEWFGAFRFWKRVGKIDRSFLPWYPR